MKQKFRMLEFVNTASGEFAIVKGSFSQLYHGDKIKRYMLYIIEDDKITGRRGWYDEEELSLACERDSLKAENMIEEYNTKD